MKKLETTNQHLSLNQNPKSYQYPKPHQGDKRPIARFYRCFLEDTAKGIAPNKCRGINGEQFRAADRFSNNYHRAIATRGSSLIQIPENHHRVSLQGFETQVQALHDHRAVTSKLGVRSRQILEHFCLKELPIRQYELAQVPQWPKGAGSTRLREALDDLIEVYSNLK